MAGSPDHGSINAFVNLSFAAVPNVINEHTRGLVALVGLGLFVSLYGCRVVNPSKNETIVAQISESAALARQLNEQGVGYVLHEQLGKAEKKFQEAIQADQDFGQAYNNLGLVFFHQHDFFEAARAFEAASEKLPDSPEPLNNLGLVMETVARPDDAIDLYQQAYELAPTNAEYLGNLLRLRVRMKLIDDDLLAQLHRLLLIEKRIEWQDWAREQLALLNNPNLDRGPAKPSSDPLGELNAGKSSDASSTLPALSSNSSRTISPPDSRTNTPRNLNVPEETLRLPPPAREELPSLEPLMLPSPVVPLPPALPGLPPAAGQPSMFPTSLPPSSRRQKSVLEVLE